MSALDRKLVRGSAWLALSYGGTQLVSLVVTAVIAHFVAPAAFGLVALASIALAGFAMLQESGLSLAVIRCREHVAEAAGTAFAFSLAASVVLYAAAYFAAPVAASLLHAPGLTPIARVLMLILPARALGTASGALIERELAFSLRARGELLGAAAQTATAIPLALAGAGVWSIVAGQLGAQAVQSVVFLLVAPRRPSVRLASWRTFRELGRFGRSVTAGNLVSLVDGNVDTVFAGRIVGTTGVGFYALAWRISNLPALGLAYIVGRVMFPAYATLQDDLAGFQDAFLTNLRRVALASLPAGIVILVAAKPIVLGLFGSAWEPAVTPLRILAVFGIVRSFAGATGAVFQAAGRPQLVFQISLWHLAVLVVSLAVLVPTYRIEGVAIADTVAAISSFVPSYWFALRILGLRLGTLLRALRRPAVCSVPLLAAVLAVASTGFVRSAVVELVVIAAVALAAYAASVASFGRAEVQTIAQAFRS